MGRLWIVAIVLGIALGGAACSFTLDSGTAGLPLFGEPVAPAAFPKLNSDGIPVLDFHILRGDDDAYWAVLTRNFSDPSNAPPAAQKTRTLARLVRLSGEPLEEVLEADQILTGSQLIYLIDVSMVESVPTRLRLYRPGSQGPPTEMALPPGGGLLLSSPREEAFVYIASRVAANPLLLLRSDGTFKRQLALPMGVDAEHLFEKFRLFFDPTSDWLITRGPDGKLVARATREERDVELGASDPDLIFDSTREALISCGPEGLRRLPLSGLPATQLDPKACQPAVLRALPGRVLYKREDGIYEVPDLGGALTKVLEPAEQVLAVGPDRRLIYSLDPPLRYGAGIGNGWLGSWQFMNRGRRPTWSSDGSRLRWLENAARSDNTGDLMSAAIPDGQPLLLSRNVFQWSEVAPGRILCISNAEGKGTYNRLILIDEAGGSARWVVNSARAFARIPGTNEVLAEIVNGQLGYDIRRVPIPL